MIIIGFALFVVAGVFGVDLAAKNRFPTRNLHVFGENLGISGSAHLYVLGAVTGAAVVIGLALLFAGLQRKGSRSTQRHREHKLIGSHEGELERLRAENADLRSRLDASDEPSYDTASSATTTAPAATATSRASSGSPVE
jgi:hypothetical protein